MFRYGSANIYCELFQGELGSAGGECFNLVTTRRGLLLSLPQIYANPFNYAE